MSKLVDFDIDKAQNGAKVVTRSGLKVKILYFLGLYSEILQVVALVKDICGKEEYYEFGIFGNCLSKEDTDLDLFIEEDD